MHVLEMKRAYFAYNVRKMKKPAILAMVLLLMY